MMSLASNFANSCERISLTQREIGVYEKLELALNSEFILRLKNKYLGVTFKNIRNSDKGFKKNEN